MRLARVTVPAENAALRLRALDMQREQNSSGLPVALAGSYGPKVRSQSHEDVLTLIEAVLGKPDMSATRFGDDSAA